MSRKRTTDEWEWKGHKWTPVKLACVMGMEALRMSLTGKSRLFTAEEIGEWLRWSSAND